MFTDRKNRRADVARYVSKSETADISLEVAYDGGAEKPGQENPSKTNVAVRCLKRANQFSKNSPWIEIWKQEYGNLNMPSGAWNGIKLSEISEGRLFIAIGNHVMEVDKDSGKPLWQLETGNTPIYHLMRSEKKNLLIVFNGYYGFRNKENLGNICALSIDGKELWRVHLPHEGDIFANAPYYDGGKLKSSSWNCFTCSIDENTGDITERTFTK